MEFGKDTLKEYINSNLRPPVFSLDWLLFKNNFYKNDIIFSETSIKIINNQIQKVIENELKSREVVDDFCNKNDLTRIINIFDSKNSLSCSKCLNLNYLSYFECSECKQRSCISHLDFLCCGNKDKKVTLFYRFKNDLFYHSKNIKPALIPKGNTTRLSNSNVEISSSIYKENNKKSNNDLNNLSLRECSNAPSTYEDN